LCVCVVCVCVFVCVWCVCVVCVCVCGVCVWCVCVFVCVCGQSVFIVCREKCRCRSAFCFRLAKETVNRHFLTSKPSASNTILCHRLGDDWIALEQGEVNREQTNSWLECDPPLRRNITAVGVRVLFENL